MNDELIQKYKRLADNEITEQPPEMWDRIQETLELEKGWDRINATLRRRKRRPVILMCLIAGLLLLTSTIGYFRFGSTLYFNSEQNSTTAERQSIKIITENNLQVTNYDQNYFLSYNKSRSNISTTDSFLLGYQLVTPNRSSNSPVNPNSSVQEKSENEYHIPANRNLTTRESKSDKIEKDTQTNVFICFSPKVAILKLDTGVKYAVAIQKLDVKNKIGYYVLTSFGIKGTVFLNSHTSKAMHNESYEYVSIKPSSSVQLGLGAQLNANYFIEGRLHINNQNGQTTHYLMEGKSIYADTRLKYTTVETSVGLCLNHSAVPRMKNFCSSIQSGLYISYLQEVRVQTNSTAELNSAKFRSSDYGMIFRYDLHRRSGPFDLSAGAFSIIGLRNISQSQQGIPSYFNRCYNLALGLNFSVKYFL